MASELLKTKQFTPIPGKSLRTHSFSFVLTMAYGLATIFALTPI